MKLNIAYTKEKDIKNFLKGQGAVNRKSDTPVEEVFLNRYSEFTEENLSKFIDEYVLEEKYDIPKAIERANKQWNLIEDSFIKKCDEIFGVSYPIGDITAYLTLNNRCTYNTENGYFFLSIRSTYVPSNIMHELLHFYTWEAFGKDMIANGYDTQKYNAIKESLTVLLNTEFKDFMDGNIDKGYTQHKEIRKKILKLWNENHSLKDIMNQIS